MQDEYILRGLITCGVVVCIALFAAGFFAPAFPYAVATLLPAPGNATPTVGEPTPIPSLLPAVTVPDLTPIPVEEGAETAPTTRVPTTVATTAPTTARTSAAATFSDPVWTDPGTAAVSVTSTGGAARSRVYRPIMQDEYILRGLITCGVVVCIALFTAGFFAPVFPYAVATLLPAPGNATPTVGEPTPTPSLLPAATVPDLTPIPVGEGAETAPTTRVPTTVATTAPTTARTSAPATFSDPVWTDPGTAAVSVTSTGGAAAGRESIAQSCRTNTFSGA